MKIVDIPVDDDDMPCIMYVFKPHLQTCNVLHLVIVIFNSNWTFIVLNLAFTRAP